MRWFVLLALVACGGDKLPAPPERAHYDKLDAEQRCEATFPRAARCIDHLLVASAGELSAELAEEMKREVVREGRSDEKEARVLHLSQCLGNRDAALYPDAVMRCWAIEDCKAFATCVYKPAPKSPGTP